MHVFMHIKVHQNFMNEYVARTTFLLSGVRHRFSARSFTTVTSVPIGILIGYGLKNNNSYKILTENYFSLHVV